MDLLREEAFRHGIPPQAVHWDHRTNRGDQGRDIVIEASHSDPNPRFIPQLPSIWSLKSGQDGIKPATLRSEIMHHDHEVVRKHLQAGNPYVWCTLRPIDENARTELREKAQEIAIEEFIFNPALVEFRTLDLLCTILNDHPGLIAKHFPDLAARMKGVDNLIEWERDDRFSMSWVDFSDRSVFLTQIQTHLRARRGTNVLHIAGLSGVGKTRIVREACRTADDLEGVLYVPRYNALDESFIRHLTRNEHIIARVIIDEMPLSGLEYFKSKVGDFSNRLRFITIGPAHSKDTSHIDSNILILSAPETKIGVLAVVRQAGRELSDAVLASIAEFSAHDLRLALMLVAATKQGEFSELPIQDGDDVWNRVTRLFRDRIGNVDTFSDHYRYLTVCIDIGCTGDRRTELEHIASEFDVAVQRLDEAIANAVPCGLGIQTPLFFEAGPRALTAHLFRHRVWPALRNRVSQFLQRLPERLLRRFMERCHECFGEERKQMEQALDAFFLEAIGVHDLSQLADRERSRLFKAWAELDPEHGLAWLSEAVGNASDEQLALLDGDPDGSGGWRGRRQIVWLCDNLACFGEYFYTCERVLFRLAQVETEKAIGNNSTGVWREMYLPILANTEISFPDRSKLLIKRLCHANTTTLSLILGAVIEALGPIPYRVASPAVVGGRLVPPPWRPKTREELINLQQTFASETIAAIRGLKPDLYLGAITLLLEKMRIILNHTSVRAAKELFEQGLTDPEIRRALRLKLDELIEQEERAIRTHGVSSASMASIDELRRWAEEIAPQDLAERVKELTSKVYWQVITLLRDKENVIHE